MSFPLRNSPSHPLASTSIGVNYRTRDERCETRSLLSHRKRVIGEIRCKGKDFFLLPNIFVQKIRRILLFMLHSEVFLLHFCHSRGVRWGVVEGYDGV